MKIATTALTLSVLVIKLAACGGGSEVSGNGGTGGTDGPADGSDAAATGGAIETGRTSGGGNLGPATSSGANAVGGSVSTLNTAGAGAPATGGSYRTSGATGDGGIETTADLPSCPASEGVGPLACGLLVMPGDGTGTIRDINLTAEVTVKAVVASSNSLCSGQRLSLVAADGRALTMDLNVTGLPKDFIRTEDRLGLTVASWAGGRSYFGPTVSQSLVITREGKTILITWQGTVNAVTGSELPGNGVPGPVSIAELSLANDGMICLGYEQACWTRHHMALVTVGTNSAKIEPKQSVRVGGLQVVLQSYREVSGGMCDQLGDLTFAAFAP